MKSMLMSSFWIAVLSVAHAAMPSRELSAGDLKFGLYLHLDVTTFTKQDTKASDLGRAPAAAFAPKALDPAAWTRIAKKAGMDFAVLTAKHESGFCLWPAKSADYSVADSPGKPDVVGAFVAACKADAIMPGIHYSIPDARLEGRAISKGELSEALFAKHLQRIEELHTRYPDIRVQIFDVSSRLSRGQFQTLCDTVKRLNPACLVIDEKIEPRYVASTVSAKWMWAPDVKPVSASRLFQLGELAVSTKRPLLLNIGVDRTGNLPNDSVAVMESVVAKLRAL